MRIVPRTEIGLPAVVRSSTGALRPPLHDEPWMTAHYTGNNIDYTYRDIPEVVRQIQEVFEKSKPFEYNYCIGQEDDDLIYEFAGKFQAAHSGGENSLAFGVLFVNGTMDPLTDAQVQKWRWLRETLVFDGALRPEVMELPHLLMPEAATACPGPLILSRFEELTKPYVPPPPVVEPDDPEEDEMFVAFVKHRDKPFVYKQFSNGTKTWVVNPAHLGVEQFIHDTSVVHEFDDAWTCAAGVIVGTKPPGVDGWGVPL